jgi:hypothetical protein
MTFERLGCEYGRFCIFCSNFARSIIPMRAAQGFIKDQVQCYESFRESTSKKQTIQAKRGDVSQQWELRGVLLTYTN